MKATDNTDDAPEGRPRKIDHDELERRVTEVLNIRLAGGQFSDLRQYASEQGWGVSDRQLRRYVEKSDAAVAAAVEQDRDRLLAMHLAQLRFLYTRAVEAADWRTALAIKKDEGELLSLYPARVVKNEHSGPNGAAIPHEHQITDADRDAIRERLLARLGHRPGAPAGDPDRNGHGPALAEPRPDHGPERPDA